MGRACSPLRSIAQMKNRFKKINDLCTAKKTINKVRRQPSEWEEIFAKKATDKEVISKIYKHLNTRKINNPIKKMGQRTKQTFIQRRCTDG